ncbi:MAG: hypothetical protein ACREXY_17535 [Gammaproteobacteria bacterium]
MKGDLIRQGNRRSWNAKGVSKGPLYQRLLRIPEPGHFEDASRTKLTAVDASLADRALAFCSLLLARGLVRGLSLDRLVRILGKVKHLPSRYVRWSRILGYFWSSMME